MNSVVLGEKGAHLPHQSGGLLVGCQGERHDCLIPLERVEGVELGKALPGGLIGQLIWRVLNEVHYLRCVCTAQTMGVLVKLGEAASKISDSKLSF